MIARELIVTCYHEIANDPSIGCRIMADDADGNPATQTDAHSFFIWLILTASTVLEVPMLVAPYKECIEESVKRRRRGAGREVSSSCSLT